MRISDWSSDVCSSDLELVLKSLDDDQAQETISIPLEGKSSIADHMVIASGRSSRQVASMAQKLAERIKQATGRSARVEGRSEEHTSELQSLMRISYAVFCLKKKKQTANNNNCTY